MRGAPIPYSNAELRFIQARQTMSRAELRDAFAREFARDDVTADHIKSVCTRHGWSAGRKKEWSAADDVSLRGLYADVATDEIARRLGRRVSAVYARAKKLGLAKSAAFLASPASGRLSVGRADIGAGTRFRKGNVPHTKGKPRPEGHPAEATQFKRGLTPFNTQPIGTERIKSGYRWTKVSDVRHVPWTHNWRQTHVLNWVKVHGAFDVKTHALKCLDGDRSNSAAANWELVPRGVLPLLNSPWGRDFESAHAELKPTLMAAAKLEHATKRRRKRTA